jgi:hypothetical protein
MDLVAEDGEAVVVYAAELRLSALHLHFTSLLHSRGTQTRVTSSLRRATPVVTDGSVAWTSRALDARGTWRAEGDGTRETLLINAQGSVDWNCMMPLARAEVELPGGRTVRGLGYVEELRMTIAPWDLPLETLRWGRFTAEGASVVWIDWRGPHTKKIVIKNGVRGAGLVEDHSVEFVDDEARLLLEEGRVLREGTLGGSALAAIAEIYPTLPVKLLATMERKVCAPATLEQPFMTPVKGWAISEVVTWG